MSKKRPRPTNFQAVTCSKCKKEAHGTPGKSHRWCGGSKKTRKTIPGAERGSWN